MSEDRAGLKLRVEAGRTILGVSGDAARQHGAPQSAWYAALKAETKPTGVSGYQVQTALVRQVAQEHPEPSGFFGPGELVTYWSETYSQYMDATVVRPNYIDGKLASYDLDVKKGAMVTRVWKRCYPAAQQARPDMVPTPLLNEALAGGTYIQGGDATPAPDVEATTNAAKQRPFQMVEPLDREGSQPQPYARTADVTPAPEGTGSQATTEQPLSHAVDAVEAPGSGPASPKGATPLASAEAAPRFQQGDRVLYWSDTHQQWMEANVRKVREGGSYDLDIKRGAHARRMRAIQGEAPAAAPAAPAPPLAAPSTGTATTQVGAPAQAGLAVREDCRVGPAGAGAGGHAPDDSQAPKIAAQEGPGAAAVYGVASGAPSSTWAPPSTSLLPAGLSGTAAGAAVGMHVDAAVPAGYSTVQTRLLSAGPVVAASPDIPSSANACGSTPGGNRTGSGDARPPQFFMGTGVEGRRKEPGVSTPAAVSAAMTTSAPRHRVSLASGVRSGVPQAPPPSAGPLLRSTTGPVGGPELGALHLPTLPFDPTEQSVRLQLLQGLNASDRATIEEMKGFRGGLNEGVWFLSDPGHGGGPPRSGYELVLKLVRCHRIATNIPTEAENFLNISREHPSIVNDPSVAFPVKLFNCLGPDGVKKNDLIVMRKVRGERLAEFIALKWYSGAIPQVMQMLEKLGACLAEFHLRYDFTQHGDFQPSNIFYEEEHGEFFLIDVGGMGIPTMETDVEHFNKSMKLLADSYGNRLAIDGIRSFEHGYSSVTEIGR